MSVDHSRVLYYKSVQIPYADDIAIITQSTPAARDTHLDLKISSKEVGLSINVDKTKMVSQTRYTRPRQNLIVEEDYRSSQEVSHTKERRYLKTGVKR